MFWEVRRTVQFSSVIVSVCPFEFCCSDRRVPRLLLVLCEISSWPATSRDGTRCGKSSPKAKNKNSSSFRNLFSSSSDASSLWNCVYTDAKLLVVSKWLPNRIRLRFANVEFHFIQYQRFFKNSLSHIKLPQFCCIWKEQLYENGFDNQHYFQLSRVRRNHLSSSTHIT